MQRSWCELCAQWETEAEWTKRHVRSLTPKEEAVLTRERRVMVVSTPATWPTPKPRPELSALAEKVRRLRSALGLSQSALARRLGVEVLTVKRWEAGKAQPREKILKRLEELEASLEGRGEE